MTPANGRRNKRQLQVIRKKIEESAPHRLQAMPLLAPVLDLPLEDNDFARTLEPKDWRSALEALLEDCIQAAAKQEPAKSRVRAPATY